MPDYSEPRHSTRRVRFFDGQALDAQDFIDEQNSHVSRQRMLLGSLLGPGVLEGLRVRFAGGGASITVQAGVAVDNAGRILVVQGDQTIALDDEQQRNRDELGVWISYRREPDTAPGSIDAAEKGGNSDDGHGAHEVIEPDRFLERPVLTVEPLPSGLQDYKSESLAKLFNGQDIVRAPEGSEDLDAPMLIAIADDEGEGFYSFPANLRNRLLEGLFDRVAELEQKLEHLSVRDRNGHPTMEFSGVNVMVTNGSGSTDNANGLGNLIVGYNEGDSREAVAEEGEGEPGAEAPGVEPIRVRTGSHNLVVGMEHSYPGYAGVIFGYQNEIRNQFSSVLGGEHNVADIGGCVLGGQRNHAHWVSSIAGGADNYTESIGDCIAGGVWNVTGSPPQDWKDRLQEARRALDDILRGEGLEPRAEWFEDWRSRGGGGASVSGGIGNQAGGWLSSVLGGAFGRAGAAFETIPGNDSRME